MLRTCYEDIFDWCRMCWCLFGDNENRIESEKRMSKTVKIDDLVDIRDNILPAVCYFQGRKDRSTGYPFEEKMRSKLMRSMNRLDFLIGQLEIEQQVVDQSDE